MPRAHDATSQVQNGVEVYNAGSRDMRYDPKLIENNGDHYGDEQLKKAFHPQMDDPESPGIHHRKI